MFELKSLHFSAFVRPFYPKQLTVYSDQFLRSLEMEPMTLALSAPSSTNWSRAHDLKCLFYPFWSMRKTSNLRLVACKQAVFIFCIYYRAQQCFCKCQSINCRDIDQPAPHRLTMNKVYSRLNSSGVEWNLPVLDSKCESRMIHTLRWQSDRWI